MWSKCFLKTLPELSYSALQVARSYKNQAFFERKYTWTLLSGSSFTNYQQGFPGGAGGKGPTHQMQETRDTDLIPGLGRSPEEMATHSIIIAWRIPWKEEPGGIQGHSPMDRETWQATVQGVAKGRAQLKWLSMHQQKPLKLWGSESRGKLQTF